jgi:LPXTG-motif cell wall-anchored protein
MNVQRRATIIRSLASTATAAGLVLASWSTPANAASRDKYHGIDVSNMTSTASVVSGPLNPMRLPNSDVFSPRDTKDKEDDKQKAKTKSPTKGTGSQSKVKGSATGTNSASKKTGASGTQSKMTKDATKAPAATGASGTNSQQTKDTTKEATSQNNGGTESNGSVAGTATAPTTMTAVMPMGPSAAQVAANTANNNGSTGTAVAGFQSGPANGSQTTAGAVNGTQSNGAIAGVQSLPSTSTAEVANLAGAGLALISMGSGVLVIKRRRK